MCVSKVELIGRAGLGLRREMLDDMASLTTERPDFLEVAPENWLVLGGKFGKQFRSLTEQYSFVCHGLSLSLGSPDPIDINFVKQLKIFFKQHDIKIYSEHLSYCSGNGHLYDLMPIPFSEESAHYVADRIKLVQDILEQRIAVENVSYYAAPDQKMSEIDFTNMVLELSDCDLLLDVNNIYVNSVNHDYDASAFLKALPSQRIAYGHIAGHYNEAEDLIIDTHGDDVIEPVWKLLAQAYQHHGIFPTLLERDFNLPPIDELLEEVQKIRAIQGMASQSEQLK
ncbi:HvfB family MNIO-type RiPP peptide maturase [Pseudoalteromonas ulvae]|uniref:HvfB family MNIO-type RiPP peptide maturase n=1 Tax=Pseudoalteromonas ulvae TaxID=107327 RepID=UPI00386E7CD8